jgi:CheY-like chemotaxis protein
MPESTRTSGIFEPAGSAEVSFERLIPHRVRDILVVASAYDAFILEEGGRLTELILNEYVNLNLSDGPRVTRVESAEEALRLIEHQRFDLIITMARVGSIDGTRFAARIKEHDPSTPVVLLAFDIGELEQIRRDGQIEQVDHTFLWTGDARLFIAIIKLFEDRWNVDHDTDIAQVRTILLVEDSTRFTSLYLPLLYTALVEQTSLLLADSVNLANRLLRLRARPKVLWAQSYEQALGLYERYRPYMLGVISDLNFPRDGSSDPRAGVDFLARIRTDDATMPALLQSSNAEAASLAREIGVHFIHKRSRKLLKELRRFIERRFGFGDFIFLDPRGRECGRARNLRELESQLLLVPDESLRYHAQRNDFSNWLRARTEFGLASRIRPFQLEDFESLDTLREYLIGTLRDQRIEQQRGIVADFSSPRFDERSQFVRIGKGSLGGKGRGLAFANAMLQYHDFGERFAPTTITVPRTAVVATDIFDEFLADNELLDLAYSSRTDEEIAHRFAAAKLPARVMQDLGSFLEHVDYPLAVRSSSLLEDSTAQPFAGIYRTYMLPNNHPDLGVRLAQLARAIKLVYASTYSRAAKAYAESTASRIEDEKMAVILQQLVGTAHRGRFYPHISGVARSHNFYPIPPMRGEDGIAVVALGLGRQVAGGLRALRFSPRHPGNIPAFSSVDSTLESAQQHFYALSIDEPHRLPTFDEDENLVRLQVKEAEQDGTLGSLVSTYSSANDRLYEGVRKDGHPVLTFAPVLNSGVFPLAGILNEVLELSARGMGSPVEMEFAIDLNPSTPSFGFLQLRRLVAGGEPEDVRLEGEQVERAWCYSSSALGNGRMDDIFDVVYVKPQGFDAARTREIALEVGAVNSALAEEGRRCILIGPGRWGSADPWLGIPVTWDQISCARVIIEASLEDFRVTPSQGTHFFQNMTSLRIAYFTVNPWAGEDRIDWDWLDAQPAVRGSKHLRHLRFNRPVAVRIEGVSNRGVLLPPRGNEES